MRITVNLLFNFAFYFEFYAYLTNESYITRKTREEVMKDLIKEKMISYIKSKSNS